MPDVLTPVAPVTPPAPVEPVVPAPDAAGVTAPPVSEAAVAAVVPAVTPAPSVPPVSPQYVAELEQRNRLAEERADQASIQVEQAALQDAVVKTAKELEERKGYTPEQALEVANQAARAAWNQTQSERAMWTQFADAIAIGKQYGVDPQVLVRQPSRQAMVQAAQQATAQGRATAELAAANAKIAALQKQLAPPQTMASGAVSSNGSGNEATWRAYGRGELPWGPQVAQAGKALGAI